MLGDMPFMALETRNSRTGNRLRMTSDEALEVMFGLRAELEVRDWVGRGEAEDRSCTSGFPASSNCRCWRISLSVYPYPLTPHALVSLIPAPLALPCLQ